MSTCHPHLPSLALRRSSRHVPLFLAGAAKEAPQQAEGSPQEKETGQTAGPRPPQQPYLLLFKAGHQPLGAEKRVHVPGKPPSESPVSASSTPSHSCFGRTQPSRLTLTAATAASAQKSPAGASKHGSLSPSPFFFSSLKSIRSNMQSRYVFSMLQGGKISTWRTGSGGGYATPFPQQSLHCCSLALGPNKKRGVGMSFLRATGRAQGGHCGARRWAWLSTQGEALAFSLPEDA